MMHASPNKQYLFAGGCDQKCRMISTLSWQQVFAFDHSLEELTDENSPAELNIYVEAETEEDGPLYEALSKPFKVERLSHANVRQIQKDSDLPRVGVSQMAVSSDSLFLATVNEQCPNLVWLWDLSKCSLASLIKQAHPVTSICWAPASQTLNICSTADKIFLWSLRGASVC